MSTFFTDDFYVDDEAMVSSSTLARTAHKARMRMSGLDLIIVDYLQQLTTDRQYRNRYEEVTQVTKAVKALAKKFDVPVLALAQLNRAANDDVPSLRHFQDTSQVEKESDVAIILWKSHDNRLLKRFGFEVGPDGRPIYLLKVDKNRNGPIGVMRVFFNPEIMLWYEGGAQEIAGDFRGVK